MISIPGLRRRPHKSLPPRDQWEALRRGAFERAGGRCQSCGRAVTLATMHGDHVLPRNPADPSIPQGPDVPANIQCLCRSCNTSKGNRVVQLPDGAVKRAALSVLAIQGRLAHVGAQTRPLGAILALNAMLPPDRRVKPWVFAPHVTTLRLWPCDGHAALTTKAEAEILAAVKHPGARVYQHADEWRVEVPRWPRPPVSLADRPAWSLGVDVYNRDVYLNLEAAPGLLVVGQTGSGKSTLVQTVVYHVARAGGRLILVDPKYRAGGAALRPFERLAALECAVAHSEDEARAALALAWRIMEGRDPGRRHPMLAVVIDEIHELAAAERATVERLAKLGREVNVQVIVATQHPTRDVVTNALKNNLTWWAAGRVQNASASTLVIGRTGAQHLGGYGDMIIAHGGRDTRIQVAMGGASAWDTLARRDAPPEPAPPVDKQDGRYVKRDTSAEVAHLVDRWQDTGLMPSAKNVKRVFGGGTKAAMRARDEALAALAG